MGWTAEVATTCARDHVTWADELPAGTTRRGRRDGPPLPGGPARRARATTPCTRPWSPGARATPTSSSGSPTASGRRACRRSWRTRPATTCACWRRTCSAPRSGARRRRRSAAPCCPACTTSPTPACETVRRVLGAVRGCLFNAPAEERLARRLAPVRDGGVVGMGFDPPRGPAAGPPGGARGTSAPTSSTPAASRRASACRWRSTTSCAWPPSAATAPSLVLMGRGGYRPPAAARGRVVELGYVTEEEKRAVYAGRGRAGEPLRDGEPVDRADGGLAGGDARDRRRRLGGDGRPRRPLGRRHDLRALRRVPRRGGAGCSTTRPSASAWAPRGRAYVLDEYGWPAVQERLAAVAERLAA